MTPPPIALVALVAWSAIAVACSIVYGQSQRQTMTSDQQLASNHRCRSASMT